MVVGCVWSRVGFDSGVSCMARSQVALAGASALVASTCGSVESRSVYDRLEADDALFVGDALVSSSTGERLEVLASGQLALRDVDGAALWTSPPASTPSPRFRRGCGTGRDLEAPQGGEGLERLCRCLVGRRPGAFLSLEPAEALRRDGLGSRR